jgi:hypothetical protein
MVPSICKQCKCVALDERAAGRHVCLCCSRLVVKTGVETFVQANCRPNTMSQEFYLRYYVGHKGKFGHEFLEFEFRPDGKLRYANNSNYKNDTMIRKEAYVHQSVMDELKRVIVDSEIMQVATHNLL